MLRVARSCADALYKSDLVWRCVFALCVFAFCAALASALGCAGSSSTIDPAESKAVDRSLVVTAPVRRVVEVEITAPVKEAAPCDTSPSSSPF